MLKWQDQKRCYWLIVCEPNKTIVGSGQLICYPHSAELVNLSVPPPHQNQGIGTAIIGILTAIAQHSQLSRLEISVHLENIRAQKLYERLGFEIDRQLRMPPAFVLQRTL